MARKSGQTIWITAAIMFGLFFVAGYFLRGDGNMAPQLERAASVNTETYRLIHAMGNDEQELARDLSRTDCESMKDDRIGLSAALGIHSETLGIGSISCLPESVFEG